MENRITHICIYIMYILWINVSAAYAWFTEALQSRCTAEAMQSSPYCLTKGGLYSYPKWPLLKIKHQSKLLTSLACNEQKIITSKSPDFKNPTLHQTLKMLQCTIKQSKHHQSKMTFYNTGKILPLAVFCPWEWKGSSNSWPYCSN